MARCGIIPAHAGKTPSALGSPRPLPDHPRSRGENIWTVTQSRGCRGSSPLTRGKLAICPRIPARRGIIPAHAGKTRLPWVRSVDLEDHPRSRGENTNVRKGLNALAGSSPLTRGKLQARHRGTPRPGIIPAHAGKTLSAPKQWTDSGDHPRSRGENGVAYRQGQRVWGSSPLTRGKPPG